MRRRLAEIPRAELIAWALLTAAAVVVRLVDLGARAYHHDESQIAYFSWRFAEEFDYEYDPLLHSPLQYYLTAAAYKLLGDGDFTARLPAVLAGVVAVLLCFGLRPFLGRLGAFGARAVLVRASAETKAAFGAFPPEAPAVAMLSARLRQRFDPRGILDARPMPVPA